MLIDRVFVRKNPGYPMGVKINCSAGPVVMPSATPPVTNAIARDRSFVVEAVDAYAFRRLILPGSAELWKRAVTQRTITH